MYIDNNKVRPIILTFQAICFLSHFEGILDTMCLFTWDHVFGAFDDDIFATPIIYHLNFPAYARTENHLVWITKISN